MKLSLISEARLSHQWLEKQLGANNPSISKIETCDPTGGWYFEWLTLLVKSIGNDEFLDDELRNDIEFWDNNKQAVRQLNLGNELASKHKLLKSLGQFYADIDKLKEHKAIKASARRGSGVNYMSKEYKGAEVLLDDGTFTVFKVNGTSPEAIDSLERLGIGTQWCTRKGGKKNAAKRCLSEHTQYVMYKDDKPLYQFSAVDMKDVFNRDCVPIDEFEVLYNAVGAVNRPLRCYAALKSGRVTDNYDLFETITRCKKSWPAIEPHIINNPVLAVRYAINALGGERWLDAEPYIMKDPESAYNYALKVLKARWLEAEPYISHNSYWYDRYKSYFRDEMGQKARSIAGNPGRVGIPGQKRWALYSESK